jgi:hypothetical protein
VCRAEKKRSKKSSWQRQAEEEEKVLKLFAHFIIRNLWQQHEHVREEIFKHDYNIIHPRSGFLLPPSTSPLQHINTRERIFFYNFPSLSSFYLIFQLPRREGWENE